MKELHYAISRTISALDMLHAMEWHCEENQDYEAALLFEIPKIRELTMTLQQTFLQMHDRAKRLCDTPQS